MIKDILNNADNYYNISGSLKKGFEWLKGNDLKNMPDGKYLIEGETIYANIQSYETKDNAPYEAHRKYIDIQYMIDGQEKVGVTNYKNCKTLEQYNKEKDIEFLSLVGSEWYESLNNGEFLVFFPNDAHKPSLDLDKKRTVKKVIVKVAM